MKHKWWKKRLKKLFTDSDFYKANALVAFFFSLFSQTIFTFLFEFNWFNVEFVTLIISVTILNGFLVRDEMYDEDSIYDKEIMKEEREEEREKAKRRYVHLSELKKAIIALEKQEGIGNIVVLLKEIKIVIDKINDDSKIESKERHYLETTLPKDLTSILVAFQELTPENQVEMNPKIIETLQKKYDEIVQHFLYNKQAAIKNEIDKRIELLQTREY